MVYQFFEKASAGSDIKNEITQNQHLTEELYKPIIKKIKKKKQNKSTLIIQYSISFIKTIFGVLI